MDGASDGSAFSSAVSLRSTSLLSFCLPDGKPFQTIVYKGNKMDITPSDRIIVLPGAISPAGMASADNDGPEPVAQDAAVLVLTVGA